VYRHDLPSLFFPFPLVVPDDPLTEKGWKSRLPFPPPPPPPPTPRTETRETRKKRRWKGFFLPLPPFFFLLPPDRPRLPPVAVSGSVGFNGDNTCSCGFFLSFFPPPFPPTPPRPGESRFTCRWKRSARDSSSPPSFFPSRTWFLRDGSTAKKHAATRPLPPSFFFSFFLLLFSPLHGRRTGQRVG